MHTVYLFVLTLAIFVIIDSLWLGLLAKKLYKVALGNLLRQKPRFSVAILFYVIYAAALVFFVIQPALSIEQWPYTLLAGGFFGAAAYATYDLTNLATLQKWPLKIVIIDMLWGVIVSAGTSAIVFLLAKAFHV